MFKDQIYLNMAKEFSKFSKCQFTQVGALAVNENGAIVATGVNGTIPGLENCCDHKFETRDDHVEFTRENELHAEANMLLNIATSSVKFNNLSIYLTISPCHECLKLILGLTRTKGSSTIHIERIIFEEKYHRTSNDELNRMKAKCSLVGTKLLSIKEATSE